MNSRQLAEKMVEECWTGWNIKHIAWDGAITDTGVDGYYHPDPVFVLDYFDTPVLEQIINLIVRNWTVGAGGTRQHTESVNNFAVYVGDHTGFWFLVEPSGRLTIWLRNPNHG